MWLRKLNSKFSIAVMYLIDYLLVTGCDAVR